MSDLVETLVALGVAEETAEAVDQVARNLHEALQFLGRQPDGSVQPHLKQWKEHWSLEWSRPYYCNSDIGYNSWEAPPCFKFAEWRLDASLFPGLSIRKARDIYLALDQLFARHIGDKATAALRVLSKLVGNVADCGNSVERYCSVKTSNPAFQSAVWDLPGGADLLLLLGWRHQGEVLSLPGDAPLPPIQAAAARLRRLADAKGHSGDAVATQPDGSTAGSVARPASQHYGAPGFQYQEQIWHCSQCNHPINDGSERLFTRRHDAPHGEYRYMCTTCQGRGTTINLCQACWDQFQGGEALHAREHAFQHVGPRLTRHNDYYGAGGGDTGAGSSSSNPWGNRSAAAGSYSRALARLGQRYGVRDWG